MNETITSAIIESASIDTGDLGLLTAWLYLRFNGSEVQGFGGYALYLPKRSKNSTVNGDFAGHFIFRCLQISDVKSWDKITGRSIRLKHDQPGFGGKILSIGHIVKDEWFNPSDDFSKMQP